ncbi:hypothetical protein [Rhodococcus sp. NPDC058521]|uniref:hypothetical protein n=1 Tax=Rhodococcus sp. NPDC058521 TaxID=3346536 RepID=UPI0036579D3A
MTTGDPTSSATANTGMPAWAKKAIGITVLVIELVIAYFILAAYLPRAWAQNVGSLAGGSVAKGVLWGLVFGVLCSFVPLLLFQGAWMTIPRRRFKPVQIGLVALGVIVMIPNLLTSSVVMGDNNAAHAGERILDVYAPGFRGATLVGVILGVLLFLAVAAITVTYRRRRAEAEKMKSGRSRVRSPALSCPQ